MSYRIKSSVSLDTFQFFMWGNHRCGIDDFTPLRANSEGLYCIVARGKMFRI